VDQEFLHAHLYEFMQAAMQSVRLAVRHEIAMSLAAKDTRPKRPRA